MPETIKKTYIREIFSSIQGEGPYVGQKQAFVRFCCCNLGCKFCDTDFLIKNAKLFSTKDLFLALEKLDFEAISFTGGEPLLEIDFLKEFLTKYKEKLGKKIYLETNGTLYKNLEEIIDLVDIVAMDIKIKSATKEENKFKENEEFLKIASKKEVFVKVVFGENILDEEIETISKICSFKNSLLILQPKMPMDKGLKLEEIFEKFYKLHKNTRLIPQVHTFLNLM